MYGLPATLDQRHSNLDHGGAGTQHCAKVSNGELIQLEPQLQHNFSF
jgi:hypothetical protein